MKAPVSARRPDPFSTDERTMKAFLAILLVAVLISAGSIMRQRSLERAKEEQAETAATHARMLDEIEATALETARAKRRAGESDSGGSEPGDKAAMQQTMKKLEIAMHTMEKLEAEALKAGIPPIDIRNRKIDADFKESKEYGEVLAERTRLREQQEAADREIQQRMLAEAAQRDAQLAAEAEAKAKEAAAREEEEKKKQQEAAEAAAHPGLPAGVQPEKKSGGPALPPGMKRGK